MLLIRLLAIFLVLITNTWLLNPVRSDALGRYKRAMAQRADRELSRLAGEPCAVSGAWRSRRQPRSLSPSQHRPPAARPRTHISRREPYAVKSAPAVCAGGCRFDTGGLLRDGHGKGSWADADDAAVGTRGRYVASDGGEYEKRTETDEKEPPPVSAVTRVSLPEEAGKTVPFYGQTSRVYRTRLPRSLHATAQPTLSYGPTEISSTDKLSPNSSADPRYPQVLQKPQQDDGDQQPAPGAPEDVSDEDYSGEVEEADAPASVPVGNSAPWGSPVPSVPASWMTALYFSGRREQLKLKPAVEFELPRSKFSVELWVKPEGGQSNPAVIAGG